MNQKYTILKDETIEITDGDREVILYRIQALRDIRENVKRGDKGGFIESEWNLTTDSDDESWIYGNAMVYGNARVQRYSTVSGSAKVFGNALVTDFSYIRDNAEVYGNAEINDSTVKNSAKVYGYACIAFNSRITDTAQVHGRAFINCDTNISGSSEVHENAFVDYSCVYGNSHIFGNAKVAGSYLEDNASISENADIEDTRVKGNAKISGNAKIVAPCIVKDNASVSGNATINWDALYLFEDREDDPVNNLYIDVEISGQASVSGNSAICGSVKIAGNSSVNGNTKITALVAYPKQDYFHPRSSINIVEILDEATLDGNTVIKLFEFALSEEELKNNVENMLQIKGKSKITGNTIIQEPTSICNKTISDYKGSTDYLDNLERKILEILKE